MNSYYYALLIPQYKEGILDVKKQTLDEADFSYILSQCSSRELQESATVIRNDIQQIEMQDSLTNQELLLIKQQQDSILKLLNKPTPKK